MTNTNITGLDKAGVLAALYNHSRQQGMGFLNPRGASDLTHDEAVVLLAEAAPWSYEFDYLFGRVLKVSLAGDEVDGQWYDRDNGPGALAAVIAALHAGAAATRERAGR